MIQVFLTYTALISTVLLLKYAEAANINTQNMLLFQRFKENYNRVYPNKEGETKGYENFVNNLAEVNELNKKHPGNVVVYQLNRYADLDPKEIKDHYGISIKPCEWLFCLSFYLTLPIYVGWKSSHRSVQLD